MSTQAIRAFIAIDLPPNLKKSLDIIKIDLSKCKNSLRWVKEENLHITLKFLGQINETEVKLVQDTLTSLGKATSSFRITLSSFGFLPKGKKPRMFFVDILNNPTLKSLVQSLENKLKNLGTQRDKSFESHITLAGIKNLKNIDCFTEEVEKKNITQTFLAEAIVLYESTLTDSGPVYERIFKANLAI